MTAAGIPALLEPIQERLDAAIPGPWEPMRAGLLGTRVVTIDGEWDEGIIPPEFINMVTPAMRNFDTAVFIAAAPADTARLLAAVKAVTEVHQIKFYNKWGREESEDQGKGGWCSTCGRFDGPGCPTVSAVEAALRGEA